MDKVQEEMQFLGLFGIYKEGYKIITSWKKIFTQITLVLILPLSFVFLAHMEVSNLLLWRIQYDELLPLFIFPSYDIPNVDMRASSKWTIYVLFKFAYLTFLIIYSLLSTSAVVYTIATIYTGREVTLKKVMTVVPKIWKRLMLTFLIIFLAIFFYNLVSFVATMGFCIFIVEFTDYEGNATVVFLYFLLILYFVGFVYMTIVWQLASVVTVLEDSYGIKAMKKSNDLIKGKMCVALIIFFMLNVSLAVIQGLFQIFVLGDDEPTLDMTWKRIGFGTLCFSLLVVLILFGLVIQTIFYFVCKSYHHENIEKSALSEHLEDYYLEDHERQNMAKDVQLEQYKV